VLGDFDLSGTKASGRGPGREKTLCTNLLPADAVVEEGRRGGRILLDKKDKEVNFAHPSCAEGGEGGGIPTTLFGRKIEGREGPPGSG